MGTGVGGGEGAGVGTGVGLYVCTWKTPLKLLHAASEPKSGGCGVGATVSAVDSCDGAGVGCGVGVAVGAAAVAHETVLHTCVCQSSGHVNTAAVRWSTRRMRTRLPPSHVAEQEYHDDQDETIQ